MFKKKIDTRTEIEPLLAERWSGRAYDNQRPVTNEQILALSEAARWAPSCFGEQPWHYIVCDKTTNRAAWDKAFTCLVEGNQSWAVDAPLLIVALADSQFSHDDKQNRWAEYDTGAATMSICIQATALGLMVHQMGGFIATKVMELFSIPEQYVAMSIMTVGYQLAEDAITAEVMEREVAPRQRAPLAKHFFNGAWGDPIV